MVHNQILVILAVDNKNEMKSQQWQLQQYQDRNGLEQLHITEKPTDNSL